MVELEVSQLRQEEANKFDTFGFCSYSGTVKKPSITPKKKFDKRGSRTDKREKLALASNAENSTTAEANSKCPMSAKPEAAESTEEERQKHNG